MPNDNNMLPVTGNKPITTDDVVAPNVVSSPVPPSSVAPADDIDTPMQTTPITSLSPMKKFTRGKVIATILGLFLLVGGIGAGVMLVGQNQNIEEKAGEIICDPGQIVNCTTSLSCPGKQTCNTTGTAWGTCNDIAGDNCPATTTVCNPGRSVSCQINNCPGTKICNEAGVFDPCEDNPGDNCPATVSCGEAQPGQTCTTGDDCHCQNGDICDSLICEPDVRISCINQERSWCENYQPGEGMTCCAAGYECAPNGIEGCVRGGGTPPPGASPSPTPGPTASCQDVKAYSETWTLLTDAQLAALRPTNKVNFCVTGVATGGSFDRARFTINGVLQPETTTIRPTSEDFCQLYTIPTATTAFDVSAEIHHVTLGWK